MSAKFFCDLCELEIADNSDGSKFTFFDYKIEKGGAVPVHKEKILCQWCTKKVKKTIESIEQATYKEEQAKV